jgi:hypothetical protein
MLLDLTPIPIPGMSTHVSPIHFAGDGETFRLVYRGQEFPKYNFRCMEVVEDDEELLAQGRYKENADRRRRLNKLPYMPYNKETRRFLKEKFITEMNTLEPVG